MGEGKIIFMISYYSKHLKNYAVITSLDEDILITFEL
jgi:hypothetical protein